MLLCWIDPVKLLADSVSKTLSWQAPEDLKTNLIPAYDIDEHSRHERLPIVLEAYAKQYRKDFTLFLKLRAKELVSGGRMIISLLGRRSDIITTKFPFLLEIVAQILCVMVSEVHFFTFFSSMHLWRSKVRSFFLTEVFYSKFFF